MKATRISYQEVPGRFYEVMMATENYIKERISHSLLELIKIRASQINHCGFCLDMHHKDALKAGETFERLYLLPAWEESPCYAADEKAVLNLTDKLTQISEYTPHEIEKAYETMTQYYSKAQIAEIVLAICQINAWNRIAITFGNIPGSYKG